MSGQGGKRQTADGRSETDGVAHDSQILYEVEQDARLVSEPGRITRYEDLRVWQASIVLAETVYAVTEALPDAERFGLTSQMRRAAVSVASNIAEGYGRGSTADYLRFLRMARGSLYELETQGVIAVRTSLLTRSDGDRLRSDIERVRALLLGLLRAVERST